MYDWIDSWKFSNNADPVIHLIFYCSDKSGQECIKQAYLIISQLTGRLIPFAKIRMYEGTATHVKEVHAEFDVVSDSSYSGRRAMIMGKLYKKNGVWKFNAIGDATPDPNFAATIINIIKNYNWEDCQYTCC